MLLSDSGPSIVACLAMILLVREALTRWFECISLQVWLHRGNHYSLSSLSVCWLRAPLDNFTAMDDVWVYSLTRDLLCPSHLGWKDSWIALFRRCWSARATLLLHFVRTIGVLRVWFASLPTFVCSFHYHAPAIHVIVVYTQVELEYVLNRYIALSSGRLISNAWLFGDLLRIESSSHAGWWL